jgi:hypothetical protein
LTVTLVKSEFCHAVVEYLAHIVGNGQVKPVFAKVGSTVKLPAPQGKGESKIFFGNGRII